MSKEKKSIEELLKEFSELDRKSKKKPRILKSDGFGNVLLDPNNPDDVEWYENDDEYDVIENEKWEKAMKYARATQAMEGLYVTPEMEALIIKSLEGEITDEEFMKLVLEMVNRK